MSFQNAVLLLALGALLTRSWHSVHRARRRLRLGRPVPLSERLQTREGERGRPDPDAKHRGVLAATVAVSARRRIKAPAGQVPNPFPDVLPQPEPAPPPPQHPPEVIEPVLPGEHVPIREPVVPEEALPRPLPIDDSVSAAGEEDPGAALDTVFNPPRRGAAAG